jgi:hypothetical protein
VGTAPDGFADGGTTRFAGWLAVGVGGGDVTGAMAIGWEADGAVGVGGWAHDVKTIAPMPMISL